MGRKTKGSKHGRRIPSFLLISVSISSVLAVLLLAVNYIYPRVFLPCANSVSCIKDLSGRFTPGQKAVYMGHEIAAPSYLAQIGNAPEKAVLGEQAPENKHIYVDLARQQLYAYDGTALALTFPVSTGKWYPTPTGDFKIWTKLRYTRMTGGNPATNTFYDLPNVPYTMFFEGANASAARGFGLHGAYWHNNFGHPMSHGCINISPENAGRLFEWAAISTPLTIYGEMPAE